MQLKRAKAVSVCDEDEKRRRATLKYDKMFKEIAGRSKKTKLDTLSRKNISLKVDNRTHKFENIGVQTEPFFDRHPEGEPRIVNSDEGIELEVVKKEQEKFTQIPETINEQEQELIWF